MPCIICQNTFTSVAFEPHQYCIDTVQESIEYQNPNISCMEYLQGTVVKFTRNFINSYINIVVLVRGVTIGCSVVKGTLGSVVLLTYKAQPAP